MHIAIPVFVRGQDQRGQDFLEFTSALNFSAGGALLAIRKNLARRSRLSLEIPAAPLPATMSPPRVVRTMEARLIRVANVDGCHLCGLRFIRPLAKVPVA